MGVAFMMVLVLTSIASGSASAESTPNILPLGTVANPLEFKSSSAKSTFGSGVLSVTSEKSEGEGSGTSEKLGSFHVQFLESKSSVLGTCTGAGDAAGTILVLGEYHIRSFKEGTLLMTAVIFLLPASDTVVFSCGNPATTIEVLGCVAGALTPESTLTKTLTATLGVTGKDNNIIKVENESLTGEENCELLANINKEGYKLSSEKTTQTLSGFEQGSPLKAVEVLVMPD